jgi:hypothetical protein
VTWIRLDDAHQDHPKIAPLSDRAYRLWVRAIAYSNRYGLNGDLTAAQLRLIRGPIRAKKRHETDLVAAGLWHSTDHGISIHDIEDYQPSKDIPPELSQKRSEAGKKGAEARWSKDGKLPLANDAPVPSRPVPSRPVPNEIDLSRFDPKSIRDDQQLEPWQVEAVLAESYGMLGGTSAIAVSKLCPISGYELRMARNTPGKTYGYFCKVVESMRIEAGKEKPGGSVGAPDSGVSDAMIKMAQEIDRKNREEKDRERRKRLGR